MSAFREKKVSSKDDWIKDDSDASVGGNEEAEQSEGESEDDEDLDETINNVEERKPLSKSVSKQPLSKKEKAALKVKELEELDDIFSEFGIDVKKSGSGSGEMADASAMNGGQTDQAEGGEDNPDDKKKKKKKKPKKKPEDNSMVPTMSKEEARAKLAKKINAGTKSKMTDAASEALKAGDGKAKKMSKSQRKKTLPEWDR